jgi:hypothetical protein
VFAEDSAFNRILHNETAFLIQRRLQRNGVPMIVLPVQLDLKLSRDYRPKGALRTSVELAAEPAVASARGEREHPSAVG